MSVEITIVGSGTLLPDDRHRSAGHLVEWEGGSILLDCGSGVLHGLARDGRDWRAISHIALTHFHTDHLGDLAPLLWAWMHGMPEVDRRPRTLLGPPGLFRILHALAAAHGEYIMEPGQPLQVNELEPSGRWEDPSAGIALASLPARHSPEALAYRVEVDGRSVGYTGDTGPHPPLADLLQGVDVLIAECAVPDEEEAENHLSPASAAALAVAADPEVLVLTHLFPRVERRNLEGRMRAEGFTGKIHVAEDGLRIRL